MLYPTAPQLPFFSHLTAVTTVDSRYYVDGLLRYMLFRWKLKTQNRS